MNSLESTLAQLSSFKYLIRHSLVNVSKEAQLCKERWILFAEHFWGKKWLSISQNIWKNQTSVKTRAWMHLNNASYRASCHITQRYHYLCIRLIYAKMFTADQLVLTCRSRNMLILNAYALALHHTIPIINYLEGVLKALILWGKRKWFWTKFCRLVKSYLTPLFVEHIQGQDTSEPLPNTSKTHETQWVSRMLPILPFYFKQYLPGHLSQLGRFRTYI